MGFDIQQKDKESAKIYHSQTCTQVGIFVASFGFAIMIPAIVLVLDVKYEKYHLEETLQYYPGLDYLTKETFKEIVSKWGCFAIVGIITGALQFLTSGILANWLEEWRKLWAIVHLAVFGACLVSIPVGFYLQVYISRVGTVLLALYGFNLFFLLLGYMLMRTTSQLVKNSTDV